MANLSQDDRTVITKHPLDDTLEHLRDSLRKAEQSYRLGSSYDGAVENPNQGCSRAISRLLYILQGHDVAFNLRSKTGNGDIASELDTLHRRVRSGDFNYQSVNRLDHTNW